MDAKRPSSASAQVAQELAEVAKLLARRARPPSAGQKEGALPSTQGKVERQTEEACRSSTPSRRLIRSRSSFRQRQGLARAPSNGKMGSGSLARFNSFGSSKMGFVQKARAAWGTGDKSRTASKESLPVESLAAQESEPALAPRPSASKTQSKKSCSRKPTNNWTVLSYFEDSVSLEREGIWWEWQWWSRSGWNFFSSWVTEQIEKAFSLGIGSCSLLHDGRRLEFDLHTGQEVNGLGRIRRIRMPCDETGELGASLCSTFCPATDRSAENTLSLWTSAVGDSKLLDEDREEPVAAISAPAVCPKGGGSGPSQSIVHDSNMFSGFSSDWFADVSAIHKPGRHGSRVKHRCPEVSCPVSCISLKDINDTPLTSADHVHHVWREEAYAALNRVGKLADGGH